METQDNPLAVFNEAQATIKEKLDELPFLSKVLLAGSKRDLEDVASVSLLAVDLPKTGSSLYDHQVRRRQFFLGNSLLEAFHFCWSKHHLNHRMRVMTAQLFLLHEYHHISQNTSSDRYYISGRSSYNKYATLDYRADALSIKARYLFEQVSDHLNRNLLKEILAGALYAGEAFGAIEDAAGSQVIAGVRLQRQLIWYFHYARADSFLGEASFDQFNLEREVSFQLFTHRSRRQLSDLCSRKTPLVPADLVQPMEFHITTAERTDVYNMSTSQQAEALRLVVFNASLDDTYHLFRAFFALETAWIEPEASFEAAVASGESPAKPT